MVAPVLDLAGVLTSYLAAGSKRRQENVENIPVTMDPLLKLHHLRLMGKTWAARYRFRSGCQVCLKESCSLERVP
jgi:hypothetical protein